MPSSVNFNFELSNTMFMLSKLVRKLIDVKSFKQTISRKSENHKDSTLSYLNNNINNNKKSKIFIINIFTRINNLYFH